MTGPAIVIDVKRTADDDVFRMEGPAGLAIMLGHDCEFEDIDSLVEMLALRTIDAPQLALRLGNSAQYAMALASLLAATSSIAPEAVPVALVLAKRLNTSEEGGAIRRYLPDSQNRGG